MGGDSLERRVWLKCLFPIWGSPASPGSEHTVNGRRFPGEIHVVHYSSIYQTLDEAVSKPGGLAVLAAFIQEGPDDNESYQHLLEHLESVEEAGESTDIPGFNVRGLLPQQLDRYYRYNGSLTTPPCFQTVNWTIFNETVLLSANQLSILEDTIHHDHDHILQMNFRDPQSLHDRLVLSSFRAPLSGRRGPGAPEPTVTTPNSDSGSSSDHPTEDGSSSDHRTEDGSSSDHPREDGSSSDHPREDGSSSIHPREDGSSSDHPSEDGSSSDHPREGGSSSDHAKEGGSSSDHTKEGGSSSDHAKEGGSSSDHAKEGGSSSDHAKEGGSSSDHAKEGGSTSDHAKGVGSSSNQPGQGAQGADNPGLGTGDMLAIIFGVLFGVTAVAFFIYVKQNKNRNQRSSDNKSNVIYKAAAAEDSVA
ncbi:uncharacterized protein [Hyperolius riggenbachi]|uniref:uncharacterized protein n=1 Tax=Hyperolius riggenbachi TaxID=752182 RepID=UPI0035A3AC5D